MATLTGTHVCDNSTLAHFKDWAQSISTAFSTFGWTQTTDTGQVNWTTIASVPAASNYVYEIWQAADTQASTTPIFIKVEYGSGSSGATRPSLRITVGTSSNGSGTITGSIISSAPWYPGGTSGGAPAQGSTLFNCYYSGDAGEIRIYMWSSTSLTLGTVFAIERSKDSSGNKTTDYFTVITVDDLNFNANQQSILTSGLIGNLDGGLVALASTSGNSTGAFNGTVCAFPAFPIIGKVGNPMLGLMTAIASDVTYQTVVTVASMYGGTHTYITFKSVTGGALPSCIGQRSGTGVAMALLMRYE